MNMDHLLFRRQFFLSPQRISLFPSWTVEELPCGYHVTVHPDLTITRFNIKNIDITLLGYILDPQSPSLTDHEILSKRVTNVFTIKDLIPCFYDLAGRYVCIVCIDNNHYIFSDTLGFRTVYYRIFNNQLWCASQPSLLAEFFRLTADKMIEEDLLQTEMFRKKTEHWYPGTISMFSDILHLLPNHFIDTIDKRQHRYWPSSPIEQLPLEESAKQSSKILERIMKSAASRFDLDVAVSSGLDSRVLLAGCRPVREQISYFTHTHPKITTSSADIRIPLMMCHQLGLEHKILNHTEKIDNDFSRIVHRNVANARKGKMINAFTIYNHFLNIKKERVIVHGVPGEITRDYFFQPPGIRPDVNLLIFQSKFNKSKIASTEFRRWLTGANSIPGHYAIRTLDLFYWEQRVGNWASTSYNEYDIAFESFTPFSCRALLTTMLGVKSKFRIAPGFDLQKKIIRNLWPELIGYDINPAETLTGSIKNLLKNSSIYKAYKLISFTKYVVKTALTIKTT